MTREEILKALDRIETAIFIAQMTDFMNWPQYRALCAERDSLKRKLANI